MSPSERDDGAERIGGKGNWQQKELLLHQMWKRQNIPAQMSASHVVLCSERATSGSARVINVTFHQLELLSHQRFAEEEMDED